MKILAFIDRGKVVYEAVSNRELEYKTTDDTNLTYFNGVYSRIFTLSEIESHKVDRIKVKFSWDDDESHDESDSLFGSSEGNFEIPVNIKFSQQTV